MRGPSAKRLIFGVGLLICSHRLHAQALGTIAGSITDPTDATVPGAIVTAVDERTNLTRSTRANQQGAYVLNSLQPSVYTITVEASGFQKHLGRHIELLADQTLTVAVQLQVGQLTDTVNVDGGTAQVDTMTGTLRQVIDQARLVELPLKRAQRCDPYDVGGRRGCCAIERGFPIVHVR